MKKKKLAALTAMLVTITVLTAGCTTYQNFRETFFGAKDTSETIKIGVLEPQTGNDSPKGELEIQGIELAHKLMPEVLGKEIELVYADTQSSIYVAETAAEDLRDKDPAAVLGSYGDAVSLTASRVFGKAEIPAIGITSTNPLITANNPYYFRVTFTDASQGQALAKYVFEELDLKQAAVVKVENEDTAAELVSEFSKTLSRLTGDDDAVFTTVEIPKNEKDFTAYAEELKASGAKAAFMPISLAAAEKMFQAVSEQGMTDIMLIGPNDWYDDQLLQLQAAYPEIRIAVASDFATDSQGTETAGTQGLYEKFLELYEKEYGSSEPPEAVALAFDAYMIAAEAIEQAGSTDGKAVQEAMLRTENFDGASGEISFNESGEPKKTININVIQNGKFVSVFTVD